MCRVLYVDECENIILYFSPRGFLNVRRYRFALFAYGVSGAFPNISFNFWRLPETSVFNFRVGDFLRRPEILFCMFRVWVSLRLPEISFRIERFCELSGIVWGCLGLSGASVLGCLKLSGSCLGTFRKLSGAAWGYVVFSGVLWGCLEHSGVFWGCLELSGLSGASGDI